MISSVVSGCSSGLGLALAKKFLKEGHFVIGLSRRRPRIKNSNFLFVQADFSHLYEDWSIELLNTLREQQSRSQNHEVWLINNAAALGEIKPITEISIAEFVSLFKINLFAHINLTQLLLNEGLRYESLIKVLAVSSGVVKNPVRGWGLYNVTKSAFHSWFLTLHRELNRGGCTYGKVSILLPGLINTAMQQKIRSTSLEKMPDVGQFLALYEDKKLERPDLLADRIFKILNADNFGETAETYGYSSPMN